MTAPCDAFPLFAAGQLDELAAESFRGHIASCDLCATSLHDQMMIEALEQTHAPGLRALSKGGGGGSRGGGGSSGPSAKSRRFSRGTVLGVLVPTLAAAGWFFSVREPRLADGNRQLASLSLFADKVRSSEVRLAYAPADVYRPYDLPRGGRDKHHEDVPISALAALEAKADWHGVAVGLLLSGDDRRAESYLKKARSSVDVSADQGALLLERGESAEALDVLDAVLKERPNHPQALFNRALALRNLELPLAAAEAFQAAAALGEKGWAEESKLRGDALQADANKLVNDGKEAAALGKAMALGGPLLSGELLGGHPDVARRTLYHAIRAADSRERLLSLVPLAERLDERAGGTVLADLAKSAAADDFAKRKSWAATYARLVANGAALAATEAEAYRRTLRAAHENDLLFGALLLTPRLNGRGEELTRLAAASGDPYKLATAARYLGEEQAERGERSRAAATLRNAIAAFGNAHVDEPVAKLEKYFAWLLTDELRTTEARAVTLSGLARSYRAAPDLAEDLLLRLADVSRLEEALGPLRAYAREGELRSDNCLSSRELKLQVVSGMLAAFDATGADEELARTPRCDEPLTVMAADSIISSAWLGGHPKALTTVATDLQSAKASQGPSLRVFSDALLAKLAFLSDPHASEVLAKKVLDEAHDLHADGEDVRRSESQARRTLAIAAAADGRPDDAVTAVVAGALGELGADGCVLALAMDENRVVAATRGATARVAAEVLTETARGLNPAAMVSPATLERLAGCPFVRVYAMPPLHGLARLLPSGVAWGYASRSSAPLSVGAHRVVVSDPIPPSELGLPRLGIWAPPSSAATWLHGAAATPSATLAALRTATEVEIHAHGIVDATESTAAVILLSPDEKGRYELAASALAPGSLEGHPIVVLGACHAAQAGPYYHEAWSLPVAFVRAGARAVFGSPSVIADAEARPFFDAVLSRIRAGALPALALRDERLLWLARDSSSWVADVIEFE